MAGGGGDASEGRGHKGCEPTTKPTVNTLNYKRRRQNECSEGIAITLRANKKYKLGRVVNVLVQH